MKMGMFGHTAGSGRRRYFWRLLLSCFAIVVIPVTLMGAIWYGMVRSQTMERARREEENRLTLLGRAVADLSASVRTDLTTLEYSSVTAAYSADRNPETLFELTRSLEAVSVKYEAVEHCYYYDLVKDKVYVDQSTNSPADAFEDMEWLSLREDTPVYQELAPRRVSDTWLLTVVSDGRRGGWFAGNINALSLARKLCADYIDHGNSLYLTDASGTVIAGAGSAYTAESAAAFSVPAMPQSVTETAVWEDGGNICFARFLGFAGLYGVEIVPKSAVYAQTRVYGLLVLGLIAVIFLATMAIAAWMARRLYQPIGSLYETMEQAAKPGNEVDEIGAITAAFRELSADKESSSTELERSRDFLRSQTLRMYLQGLIGEDALYKENEALQPDAQEQCILVAKLGSAVSESASMQQSLSQVLNTYLTAKGEGIFTEVEKGTYAALVRSGAQQVLETTQQAMREITGGQVVFCQSGAFRGAKELLSQYDRAQRIAGNMRFFGLLQEAFAESAGAVADHNGKGLTGQAAVNYEAGLIRDILLDSRENAMQKVQKLCEDLKAIGDEQLVKDIAQRILITILRECKAPGDTEVSADQVTQIRSADSLPSCRIPCVIR